MRYPIIFFSFIATIMLITSACQSSKQSVAEMAPPATPPTTNPLDMPLEVAPEITIGSFENGLKYYIRKNAKPEQRAELRLVVDAGSILEDDDQLGLAHFAEHMAFNGTENFAKQELVDYLESIGMRFGPDLNAYTSFDETVYMLQIPTDSSAIVETAFQILEEWAHRVVFDGSEIDKERGVVLEEWRSGRGASARMRDEQFPILFYNSRYADRLPIGKPEILENFDHDTIRRYYRDWYRPDLMAVVAVGDFDKDYIESLIKKHFGSIPGRQESRPREYYPVPGNKDPLVTIATDPEASNNQISIYYKKDVNDENSVRAYRQSMLESLYTGMLNNRLDELRQKSEPPYLYAGSGLGRFIRTRSFFVLQAVVQDNGLTTGLDALLTEALRVRQHGFTESELARQKTVMLRGMQKAFEERDKTQSRRFAAEYIRNFLENEPIPGIEREFELYQKYLPEVTLAEVNALSDELITATNQVILVSAPEKEGLEIPTKHDLLSVFSAVHKKTISPYVDAVSDEPLIANLPPAGSIAKETVNEKLGTTEWQLSNGMRLILKPTDFKNDQVLLSAYSPGGHSLVSDEDFTPASTATLVLTEGGLGNFSQIELDKKLAGKVVSVNPGITDMQEGFSGSASPQDLETLFQLVHLYFTAPRKDPQAYQSIQARIRGILQNRSANPGVAFRDTINTTMSQNHYRSRPLSEAILDEMDLDRSLAIYRERFADAGDFTFFLVGNIDPEKCRSLATTYLASLPSLERVDKPRDVGIRAPKGIIKKTVVKGLEPKSQVQIIFSGDFEWNRQNRYDMSSMTSVLRIMLRESLREDKGGTYGVGISASQSHYPRPDYQISIRFGCSPDRVDELISAVFQQIDSLKQFGPSEKNLGKVGETQRRTQELNLKKNTYWLSTLEFYDTHGEDPLQIFELEKYIATLSKKSVQQAAKRYLDTQNYVQVVLKPEAAAQ